MTPPAQGKHTIFGKVTGDTIFNVLRMGEAPTDLNDRPLEPIKLEWVEVLANPFDDIVPRCVRACELCLALRTPPSPPSLLLTGSLPLLTTGTSPPPSASAARRRGQGARWGGRWRRGRSRRPGSESRSGRCVLLLFVPFACLLFVDAVRMRGRRGPAVPGPL